MDIPWPVGNALDRGKNFRRQHSYELSWRIMAIAGLLGAVAIYATQTLHRRRGRRQATQARFATHPQGAAMIWPAIPVNRDGYRAV